MEGAIPPPHPAFMVPNYWQLCLGKKKKTLSSNLYYNVKFIFVHPAISFNSSICSKNVHLTSQPTNTMPCKTHIMSVMVHIPHKPPTALLKVQQIIM